MMIENKNIEDISNVEAGYYIVDNANESESLVKYLKSLPISLTLISDISSVTDSIVRNNPDIFFIDQRIEEDNDAGIKICRYLRGNGYKGIIILCVNDPVEEISNFIVTSIGFDGHLPIKCDLRVLLNQLHWAILNRRRKNKNILQFDNNPDQLYTVDPNGKIFDINETATRNSAFHPKEVVTDKIKVKKIGTLPTFEKQIKPLITRDNIGKVFEHISDEQGIIYQIKVMITNLPVIGLAASVFKTDITRVMFSRTLDILTNSIELLSHRDNYTAGHSSRVFYYCAHIVKNLEIPLSKKFIKSLYCAALLHDIGKIGVRDKILLKPGRLNDVEFEELCSHPVKGCNMLSRYQFLDDSVDFIKFHHERPDGNGYPARLRDKDIPLGSAVIAVADSFDAMTSKRPYRDSLGYENAIGELEKHSGTQFNHDVAKTFLSVITPELMGKIQKASQKPLESIANSILSHIQGDA